MQDYYKQSISQQKKVYGKNDNFTFDQASLFYGGRIYGKVGAFSQLTYDGYENKVSLDNTDIRFANQIELFDTPITYGISANNTPTVQDLWNTTPAWGFPYNGSAVAPGVISAVVDGAFAGQVGGASAYAMIDNLLYLEAGGYGTLGRNLQKGLGVFDSGANQLDGAAPYWRMALQKNWKGHYFSVGHYGMMADVYPGYDHSTGTTDKYTDIAFDATYQFLANLKHIFEVKSTYIFEDQQLSATRLTQVDADGTVQLNPKGRSNLNIFKMNAAYTYDQTYGVTFGYNALLGSNSATQNPDDGSYSFSRPNSQFYTAELVYVPFGKQTTSLATLLNLRTSLQYIGYAQFNGVSRQSSDNNTFMVNAWLIF